MSDNYNNNDDVTTIVGQEGCVSPITISPYKPIKIIRVVISKGAPGRPGLKGDKGNDGKDASSTTGTLKGLVDGGGADDPVSGQPIFQNNKLIGLGGNNNGRIHILVAEVYMSSYGNNKSFDFDPLTGTIDLSYGGNLWNSGDTVSINLNQ